MKLPVILVTGFLGSGKTTFLKHLAASHSEWRIAFLVNEFANTSLENQPIAKSEIPTEFVVGGSLFCDCKAGEFLKTLRERVIPLHHQSPLDALVIETSGIANPDSVGQILTHHDLQDAFEIHRIVSIVSPYNFLKLADNLPVTSAQILYSDLVIINKTDLASKATISRVEVKIRKMNPHADIIKTQYAEAHVDLGKHLRVIPNSNFSNAEANPYSTRIVELNKLLAYDKLEMWLKELPDFILRIKGIANTDRGTHSLDATIDGFNLTPATPSKRSKFVVIVHDDHEHKLDDIEMALFSLAQGKDKSQTEPS